MNPSTKVDDKRAANRRHWDQTLDARNLGADNAVGSDWRHEVDLAESADVRLAIRLLHPLGDKIVLDLGGGLGIHAILFAEAGARVVIADISVERLKVARELIRRTGYIDRVSFIACGAEELPFVAHAFDRQFTKSVLIHTQLGRASAELVRTLSPRGSATFIEPLTGNPFVNAYRRIAAPDIWQNITDYFDRKSLRTLGRTFRASGYTTRCHRIYFLAFFASVFHFLLPSVWLQRRVERALLALDRLLFRAFPSLRGRCWFSVTEIRPKHPK
ncbi:MAG: methyltransferase domain-containing protein [Candidatus Sumerlaeia bacterium]|nr:methyltransferase domain-containing protein [Candidatus Sumerlaeia bacterium]